MPSWTVLVVEDDVLVRAVTAAYLRDCGFEVIEASSADEAVRVIQAAIPVDLVFSDVNMPGSMDGFGLARWLGRERPELKVLLASGATWAARDDTEYRAQVPVLTKPYAFTELERRIRAVLAR